MVWLGLLVVATVLAALPLLRLYRACVPQVIEAYDADGRATAFDPDDRALLAGAGFTDEGAQLILIDKATAVTHLYRRETDGTVVTGLSQPDGSHPAHYVTTVLAEGRGWLDTRRTDRTPGPRQELVQVLPESTLREMIEGHDRALQIIRSRGLAPVRTMDAFGVHLHQGHATRRSLRQNPLRWLVALVAKSLRPDERREVATMADLDQRLAAMGLA